jgi:predicted DNA-binding transcriptional regulator AlpA
MAYFGVLSPDEQLEAYREIRDRLVPKPESPEAARVDDLANARLEALEVFRRVSKHLGIDEGGSPSPNEFDSACKALGLPWNKSKVIRTFQSWRRARDTFLGRPVTGSPEERRQKRRAADNKREELLAGVKLFLETKPKAKTVVAYNNWRKSYNAALPKGRLPVVSANHIAESLCWPWPNIIAVAQGKMTSEEAELQKARRDRLSRSLCRGPHQLLGLKGIEEALGLSRFETKKRIDRKSFPRAVIQLRTSRLWLKDEIEQYKRGEFKADDGMAENALRHLYLTRKEVTERTGLSDWRLEAGSSTRKPLQPGVAIGNTALWLIEAVEAWEKERDVATVEQKACK